MASVWGSTTLGCLVTFLAWWAMPVVSEDVGGAAPGSSPDSLAGDEVAARQIRYRLIMAALAALVLLLGVGSVWARSAELSLGPCPCGCFRIGPVSIAEELGGQVVFRGAWFTCFSREDYEHSIAQARSVCLAVFQYVRGRLAGGPTPTEVRASESSKHGDGEESEMMSTSQEEHRTEDETVIMSTFQEEHRHYGPYLRCRRVLLAILFVVYATASAGVPALNWKAATCDRGFFWEDHLPFMWLFFFSKVVETCLYALDPTVHGELPLQGFMLKFLASCLGFVDGYTDAVAVGIAGSCPGSLAHGIAVGMALFYLVGVLLAQWLVLALISCSDPSHACLMKLLHMDALAACVTLPNVQSKRIWVWVNVVRTVLEDLPQALLQTLFLVYVRHNYIMLVSVAVSAASSCKAIYDAITRSALAAGVQRFLDQQAEARRLEAETLGLERSRLEEARIESRIERQEQRRELAQRQAETAARRALIQEEEDLLYMEPSAWRDQRLQQIDRILDP